MENDNLKKLLKILSDILDESEYQQDNQIIKETYKGVNNLYKNKEIITNSDLESIDSNIKYLDRKYDNLNELLYLYDPIQVHYKNEIHKKEVEKLRMQNKLKKKGE